MANVKGFAIRGLLKYVKEKQQGSTKEIIAKLPPDVQQHFTTTIVTSSWYPYAVFTSLLRAIDATFGRGDLRLCEDVGTFAAEQDVRGIFKMMLSILNPDTLLKRSPIFWSKYSDSGKFVAIPGENDRYAVRLVDFPEMDVAHCHLMRGWMIRLGRFSKADTSDMQHTVCVNKGGAFCQWEGTWKPL